MPEARSVDGLTINNEPIGIVPNSFKYKRGKGEINVRSASTGGGGIDIVTTRNAEDNVGMMSFDMYVTPVTENLFNDWKSRIESNVVQAQQLGQNTLTMNQASLSNDPEFEPTADGKVTIEFKGAPF